MKQVNLCFEDHLKLIVSFLTLIENFQNKIYFLIIFKENVY